MYVIEEFSLRDAKELKKISIKTFYDTFKAVTKKENLKGYLNKQFSSEQLISEIKNYNSKFYIVRNYNEVVAYMKLNISENSIEIQRLYVIEEYKNKNIGKKLLEEAIQVAKISIRSFIWLGVWEQNMNAIRFYERQGFIKYSTSIFKLVEDEYVLNLMKLTV